MKTFKSKTGKEKKQLRLEQEGRDWTTTQWSKWKEDDWSKEHRSDQTWGTKDEMEQRLEEMSEELESLGWEKE